MNKRKVKCRGRVVQSLGYGKFKIELMHVSDPDYEGKETNVNGLEANGYVSGKMRQNHISILVGDEVIIEVQLPDMERGRIIYRHKKTSVFNSLYGEE